MTLPLGTRLGPYEVEELLGAGGMGEVYRAHDPRLGREVAVKVLPSEVATEPERLQRFEREARAVASLNHPHILTVYDVGTDDGLPYVVTELVEGETLRETLDRRSPTQKQVLSFAVQAAQGLAAAHRKGVIHRDLKPERLFVTTEGRLKILDFGLAKLTAAGASLDTAGSNETGPTRPGVALGTVAYMSPEQVEALPVDARSDIFSFGVVLHESLSTRHPFRRETVAATLTAILHDTPTDLGLEPTGLPPALAGIVARCVAKRPEDRFQTSHDLALALEAVLQAPTDSAALQDLEERSPYPGLQSFTEKDASVFFGREGEVQELWARIRSRKLLAVIGPSGVGKTSFIRAGVLANRPPGWGTLVATPGAQPFRSLGRALGPELAGDSEALARLVDFEDPETAFELLSRWRKGQEEALVVLDQFEELFTLNPPEVQERFAGVLGRLAKEGDVHVALSLRDDFLMGCHDHEPLAPVFRELTPLGALKPEDLRRALVEPAKKQGYHFEDEALVEEMVVSVEGARAALPLLAFAVSRLWERRDREKKLLKRESYEAIGGVAGALAQHAEQTLERIGPERQPLVREMFRNLVTSQGTRAVADREELLSVFTEKRESAEEVLKALVDSRLLTSYEATDLEGRAPEEPEPGDKESPRLDRSHRIEIAHESLLKAWPRLVRWQAQDEEGAVLRDQLKQAAHLWEEKSRSPDVLWSGTALQEYQLWRERYTGKLTALEEDFAHSMIERDRRRKRVRRGLVAAAFVALAAVAAAIAVSRQDALDSARRAEASQLLALGQASLDDDPTEALALATASLELADSAEARVFAVKALSKAPPARELDGEGLSVRSPYFSPDGAWLAAAGHAAEVGVWSEDGRGPLRLPGHEISSGGPNVAGWTDEDILVTGLNGNAERLHVWGFPGGKRIRTIDLGSRAFWQVGPEYVVTETELPTDGPPGRRGFLIRRWRLPDGSSELQGRVEVAAESHSGSTIDPHGTGWLYVKNRRTLFYRPLPSHPGEQDRALDRFDSDGRLYQQVGPRDKRFLSTRLGRIQVWSFPPEGPVLEEEITHQLAAVGYAFPDTTGRWLTSPIPGMQQQEARLWDLRAFPGARARVLRRSAVWYGANATIHPAGDWYVASTSNFTRLTFWPLHREYPVVVDGYAALRRPVSFSPDGRWVASAWSGGELRLWPLDGTGRTAVRTLPLRDGTVWGELVFDPDGRYLFGVGSGGRSCVVPLDDSPPRCLEGFSGEDWLGGAAVSPSGRLVATAPSHKVGPKTLRVWDLDSGALRQFALPGSESVGGRPNEGASTASGYEGGVDSFHFLDESTLLTAGDGGVRRWNLEDGSERLVAASSEVVSMAAGPEPDVVITVEVSDISGRCAPASLVNHASGTSHALPDFGECVKRLTIDASGTILAAGDEEGVIRVGRLSGAPPHLLFGHKGVVQFLAISPDLRWIGSTGEDNTLRLWPMPDLDKPPLHTLPRDELIAKLRSLTNIRAVRDPEAPDGWSIQLDPFPGWKDVPTW